MPWLPPVIVVAPVPPTRVLPLPWSLNTRVPEPPKVMPPVPASVMVAGRDSCTIKSPVPAERTWLLPVLRKMLLVPPPASTVPLPLAYRTSLPSPVTMW